MRYRVDWSKAARLAARRTLDLLEPRNPDAAIRVTQALLDAGNTLAHFPNRGRPVPGTDRRELFAEADYVIRYRVVGDVVRIERVRHGKRRPTSP